MDMLANFSGAGLRPSNGACLLLGKDGRDGAREVERVGWSFAESSTMGFKI
jgi:hypothetical protein